MSRTIATSQSREPPSTHAVPDRPPPTSGAGAEYPPTASLLRHHVLASRQRTETHVGQPSLAKGHRAQSVKDAGMIASPTCRCTAAGSPGGQPTGALGRDRGRATTKGLSRSRERVFARNSQVRPGSAPALKPIVVSSATARVARDHGGTMNDSTAPRGRTARWAGAAGLLAAGAITGGILAGTLSANAATTTPSSSDSSTSSSSTTTEQPRATYPAHGTAEHEALEKPVTGSAASQAQAAAVKAVGSGTAGDVTTDVSGNGYEVTVSKSDGSTVEVHLDSSFTLDDHGRTSG